MLGRSAFLCLYGGSGQSPAIAKNSSPSPHIDGLFIGRSAWDVAGYLDILAKVSAAIRA